MKNNPRLFSLILLGASQILLPFHLHAQAVWSGLDDRNPYYTAYLPEWSYGYVAPDQNGNGGHAGNWSGNLAPGVGGPLDAYLGSPGGTLCDVTATLNSVTIAPGGTLNMNRGSSLTVANTNITTTGTMTGSGSYTNTGTLTLSAGAGAYTFATSVLLDSTQGSKIAVTSGTLQLPGNSGVFDTVTFSPAAGTLINLVNTDSTGAQNNIFQGTLSNGAGTGTVLFSGGTMLGAQRYLDNPQPCVLAFTGSVFQWMGGIIGSYQQGAIFTNTGVVNLTGDGTKETYANFTNAALVTQSGAGTFNVGYYNSGGSFTNAAGATYDLQSDASIGQSGYAFNNAGLFKKSGGTGASTLSVAFNNQGGTVEVDSGTLQLPINQNSTSTGGAFNVAAGAVLDLGDGEHFTGAYTGSGAGVVQLSQGTDPNNLYTDSKTGATFNFPGSLFQWTGGTLGGYQGSNLVTNLGTLNLSGANTKTSYAVFTNSGLVTQSGAGTFNVGYYNSGGSFTNAAGATYDLQSDASIGQSGYAFNNAGLFKKSGGTGASTLSVAFNNQGGTVEVDSGTLQFPLNQNSTSTGGTFNVAAGAVLDLGDGEHFTGVYTGSGAGAVQLSKGTDPNNLYTDSTTGATFNFPGSLFQWTGGSIGSYQGGHLVVNAGTINLSGSDEKLNLAKFTNNGTMIQTGAGNFDTGVVNSGGSFTNAAGAVYDLQSDGGLGQSGYPFTNAGLLEKTAGAGISAADVTLTNSGTITVATGTLNFTNNISDISNTTLTEGSWNVADGAALEFSNYGNGITINQGNVSLTGVNSKFPAIDKLVDNQGSLSLLALRELTTAGALSNEGTITVDAGSTLHVMGDLNLSEAAAVTSSGRPKNGARPRDFLETGSVLHMVVGGTASQGVNSAGLVQVSGAAKLAGRLEIALAALAAPNATDSVTVLGAESISGAFSNVAEGARLATSDGKGSFQVNAAASNRVILSAYLPVGTSAPPSVTFIVPNSANGKTTIAEGGPKLKILASRTGDLSQPLTVIYKASGSAIAGTDYKAVSGTVTIPAGAATAKIKILAYNDGVVDGPKVLKLKLQPDSGYTLGALAKAKITILDAQ